MKTRTVLLILVVSLGALFSFVTGSYADPDKAVFISKVVYSTDAKGDYQFEEIDPPAAYEFTTPHVTAGQIYSITVNYEFTGQVAMELGVKGDKKSYFPVTDGVPYDLAEADSGNKIIWKATLAEGSTLTKVSITYMDTSGVVGSFGNPELSGYMFRKPVYIKGQGTYHYQVPIKIGESSKATDCDAYLKGVIQADFSDCRFTKADQETVLPHYLDYIKGETPNRTALFYVRIPQIPEEGALIYLYYGNAYARDTSDGSAVFDFFDDFNADSLDAEVWDSALDAESSVAMVSDSELRLDGAKVTSKVYKITDGILEYRARSSAAAIESLIENIAMFSSTAEGTEHSIALGASVKVNDEKPITLSTYYLYQVIADGEDVTFQRYDDNAVLEADTQYAIRDTQYEPSAISLYATADSTGSYYDYVRVRKYLASPPAVDTAKTKKASEEVPNIAEFNDIGVSSKGELVLENDKDEGSYISPLINAPYETRIIIPAWKGQGATVDISAKEYATYKGDCSSGTYYYASKKDFTEGDELRFRIALTRDEDEAASLEQFTMDFRPGSMQVIKPNGGEKLETGKQYAVYWDASQYDPKYKIDIAYSLNGGKDYTAIAEKVSNSGQYLWTTPGDKSPKCLIKVSDSLKKEIYDISNAYFSTVPEGEGDYQGTTDRAQDTEEAVEEIPEEPAEDEIEQPAGTILYELLVKVEDGVGYKEGDIVMVKPAGFIWGRTEKENFLIVKAYLTKTESEEIMKPEISYGKILQRRRHSIDLKKHGLAKKSFFGAKRLLQSKPLLESNAIEMKRPKTGMPGNRFYDRLKGLIKKNIRTKEGDKP